MNKQSFMEGFFNQASKAVSPLLRGVKTTEDKLFPNSNTHTSPSSFNPNAQSFSSINAISPKYITPNIYNATNHQSIGTYNPVQDKQNVYGNNLQNEVNVANTYNTKNHLPIWNHLSQTNIPVTLDTKNKLWAGYNSSQNRINISSDLLDKDQFTTNSPLAKKQVNSNLYSTDDVLNEVSNLSTSLGHEGRHAFQLTGDNQFGPRSSEIPTDYNNAVLPYSPNPFKELWRLLTKRYNPPFARINIPRSTDHDTDIGEQVNYLSSLQEYLYKNNGSRISSPTQADAFFNSVLHPATINNIKDPDTLDRLMNKMTGSGHSSPIDSELSKYPFDVQRLLKQMNYNNLMKQRINIMPNEEYKQNMINETAPYLHDEYLKKILPGIVQSNQDQNDLS